MKSLSLPFVPNSSRSLIHHLVPVAAWFALAGLSICLSACGPLGLDRSADESTPVATESNKDLNPALVIEGRTITIAELNMHMQEQFLKELMEQPEDKIYELRENAARDFVQRHVIDQAAAERNTTAEALFVEITSVPPEPTDEDVRNWFDANQARLRGAPFEAIAENIKELLVNETRSAAWTDFVGPKIKALDWQMSIEPPRKQLAATRLIRGAADAPVTIMAFSDYQCPYCIRSEPILAEVLARYPGSVRLIQRHFPLDSIHPFARPAAEAAMCAEEQQKFWEFHDAIFARNGRLEAGSFLEIGRELGLDVEALGGCIDERRHRQFVQDDFVAGQAAGVEGTPAFFVNGIAMKGSRDVDDLSRVIDSELERIKQN